MTTGGRAIRPAVRDFSRTSPRRVLFVGLLVAAPFLPHMSTGRFEFPAVSNAWVCLPFGALMLLPLLDRQAVRRIAFFDLVALLSFVAALMCERPSRAWPVLLIYPPLIYLGLRMAATARLFRGGVSGEGVPSLKCRLPTSWLLVGVLVLALIHVSWALEGDVNADVATGSVYGAEQLVHGRPLYEAPPGHPLLDPHTDTYGPVNYEAYVPQTALGDAETAARTTTLLFDLMTGLLLFLLGRRVRGPSIGILLAYCWLAFPFTLYENALAFNDSIVAAGLVGTLLAANSSSKRGVMAAVVGWTKLSPLALIPLLASYGGRNHEDLRHRLVRFSCAFGLATIVIFLPALAHSSVPTFVSRSFGFQASRPPALSVWEALQSTYSVHAHWLSTVSRVAHGLLSALAITFAVVLFRVRKREDLIGLAAASAAVLIALQVALNYYSYSYLLWFMPLVLVAVIVGSVAPTGGCVRPAVERRGSGIRRLRPAQSAYPRSAISGP